jgi:hypothetical protein
MSWASCPLCGAPGVVDTVVESAFYEAHCGSCFDRDPKASGWAHLLGSACSEELAVEHWLEQSRQCAVSSNIPPLSCSYEPADLFADLARQVSEETDRQRGFRPAAVAAAVTTVAKQ